MSYCTHCNQDYPDGTVECPVCQLPLDDEEATWRPYDPNKPLVEVAFAQGELLALLIKGRLENQGIPAVVQHESAGVVYGLTIDGWGAQHILVPEDLAEVARGILGEDAAGAEEAEDAEEQEDAEE
jgi:hypothetical protein